MDTATSYRIDGIDLARFIAIAGMLVVHASTDLVMLPLERMHPDTVVPTPSGPHWAEALQGLFSNRARPLFITLAGLGLGIMAGRRGIATTTILKRAAFLATVGIALIAIGWSDFVLVLYGVMFVMAVGLLRLGNRSLVIVIGALLLLPAVLDVTVDPDSGWIGVGGIVSEIACFCAGILIARHIVSVRAPRALLLSGAVLAAPGLAFLAWNQGLNIFEVTGLGQHVAASTSTLGLCVLLIGLCDMLGSQNGWIRSALRPLVRAGRMPLTLYVAHAVAFTVLSRVIDVDLAAATIVAGATLAALVLLTNVIDRTLGYGPLEAAMRRCTG